MKLTQINKTEIPMINYKRNNNKLQKIIADFVASDMESAEITFEDGEYANLFIGYRTLKQAVVRSRARVEIQKRGDRVFIVK